MKIEELCDSIGWHRKTVEVFVDEENNTVKIFYPNYMEMDEIPQGSRGILTTLQIMEELLVNHRRHVNKDLKTLRLKIKELKGE